MYPDCTQVGEIDIFRDEDIQYISKLGRAGVECEFHLFPQVPHAWEAFAPESEPARTAMELRCKTIMAL